MREKACVTQTAGSKVNEGARDGEDERWGRLRRGQGIQRLNAYVSFLRTSLATEQRQEKEGV